MEKEYSRLQELKHVEMARFLMRNCNKFHLSGEAIEERARTVRGMNHLGIGQRDATVPESSRQPGGVPNAKKRLGRPRKLEQPKKARK